MLRGIYRARLPSEIERGSLRLSSIQAYVCNCSHLYLQSCQIATSDPQIPRGNRGAGRFHLGARDLNNNSTDHTDEVVKEYSDRLPMRRVFEPRPGLSNARNQAIDAAKGEYIIWIDDDVVVDAGWLRAYVEAFRRWPEAAVFGGRIVPRYEARVARWVIESEDSTFCVYAIRNFGDNVQPLSIVEDRLPFGANFAIRAAEQRAFRYDPNLGVAPNRRRLHDETDVITRLLESGAPGYWIPDAVVEHCIGRERQTIRYIADFFIGDGETYAFQHADDAACPSGSAFRAGSGRA